MGGMAKSSFKVSFTFAIAVLFAGPKSILDLRFSTSPLKKRQILLVESSLRSYCRQQLIKLAPVHCRQSKLNASDEL